MGEVWSVRIHKIRWNGGCCTIRGYSVAQKCFPVCWPSIWPSSHSLAPFHSHWIPPAIYPCARWIAMCWVLISPWEALHLLDIGSYAWPCWRCRHGGWPVSFIAWQGKLLDRKLHKNNHTLLVHRVVCFFFMHGNASFPSISSFRPSPESRHFQHSCSNFH